MPSPPLMTMRCAGVSVRHRDRHTRKRGAAGVFDRAFDAAIDRLRLREAGSAMPSRNRVAITRTDHCRIMTDVS